MGWLCRGLGKREYSTSVYPQFEGITLSVLIFAHILNTEGSKHVNILILYQEQFYQSRIDRGVINNNDLGLYVFASKPSSGAAILKF